MRTKLDVMVVIMIAFVMGMLLAPMSRYVKIAHAEPVDQYQGSWMRIEDSAAEDGANFAATLNLDGDEGAWASKTSEAIQLRPQNPTRAGGYSYGSNWMFAFYGTDAANETFSFTLVGWAQTNGMAQIICEGDGILGTQDVVTEPNGDSITNGLWADTISLDEQTKWPNYDGSLGTPGVSVHNSTDNEVALLYVNLAGIEWIDFVTYDVAGTAEATSLGVYGRRY